MLTNILPALCLAGLIADAIITRKWLRESRRHADALLEYIREMREGRP